MPWTFPLLTALRNARAQRFGAPALAPAAEEDGGLWGTGIVPVASDAAVDTEIPEGAGVEIPAAPSTVSVAEVPTEQPSTFEVVGGPVYKGSVLSAEGVKFDIYYRAIPDFPYGVKCPSSPFFDKMDAFRTYDDAKWYVQEVVHGSVSEKEAAAAAAREASQKRFERTGFI